MNTTFTGTLFTGETLTATPVTLAAGGGRLCCQTEGVVLDVAVAELRTSDHLASLPRFLYLPDGRTIATPDNDAIDALLAGQGRGWAVAAIHWLETRARVAAAATLLLVATVGGALWWGLPLLARNAAMAVPPSIEKQAGQSALLAINRLLAPTQLTRHGKVRVNAQLDRLLAARPLPARPELVFRSMGGKFPNAFALPGGFIVVSDELVALANDDELAAVLAHEIGHWQLRHGLQGVLRSSSALLVVCTITGDLSTLTTFAGTIPFVLLQRGYSREFEEEADTYAVNLLRKTGINVAHFVTILKKLEDARPAQGQDLTYLSTHPATASRIQRINPLGIALPVTKKPDPPAATYAALDITFDEEVFPLEAGPGHIPPHSLYQPGPLYPHEMALAGQEGRATVEFIIDKNGHVRSPRIVQSTHKEFEAPAVDAVRQWRFTPGQIKGRNVATRASQVIEFNLEDTPGATAPAGFPLARKAEPKS